MCVYIFVCEEVYVHTFVCYVCVCVCMCVHACVDVHTCTALYMYESVCQCVCVCLVPQDCAILCDYSTDRVPTAMSIT